MRLENNRDLDRIGRSAGDRDREANRAYLVTLVIVPLGGTRSSAGKR